MAKSVSERHELDTIDSAPDAPAHSGGVAQLQHDGQREIDSEPAVETPRSQFNLFAILVALFVRAFFLPFSSIPADWAYVFVQLSLFVAALDATIVATAIPTISSELHSASGYTWIGGAYLIGNAAASPIWAKLSDIWGRKPILLAAVAIFFFSSIICALSTSMKMLIIGRSIQGVAAGGLILLVNIVISDLFSMRWAARNRFLSSTTGLLTFNRSRSLYLGLLEFVWALAGGIGPVLGGTFTQLVSWRWNWWINLPISGSTFILLLLFLDVHNPRTKLVDGIKAIDWFGCITILGLTLMLLLGLDFGGETFPWNSPKVICLIVLGGSMSILFIYSEKRFAKYPLIPLELFKHKSNIASLLVCSIHGFVFISGEYYLPLYFQSVKQASPLHSGVLSLALAVVTAAAGVVTGFVIHKTGRYLELMWVGTTMLTLGFGLYINLDAHSSIGKIIGFEMVAGIGTGLLFEPPLIAIQSLVAQDDTATATSTFSFVRNVATALSIVIGGVVFQNSMQLQQSTLLAAGLSQNLTAMFSGRSAAANVMVVRTISDPAQQLVVKEAFAWSMRNMWILFTSVGFVGVVSSFFISKQELLKTHTETVTGLKKDNAR